jgi:alpha-beta hydrolase superfamily lysophospholipase
MWALENAAGFTLPLLLMHGNADWLDSSEASKEFAVKAGSKVTLKLWDGGFHEIHNEPEKADVFKVRLDWLGKY